MKDADPEEDTRAPTFVSLSNDINGNAKTGKNSAPIPQKPAAPKKSPSNGCKSNSATQENKSRSRNLGGPESKPGDEKLKEAGPPSKRKLGTKEVEKIIVRCLDVDSEKPEPSQQVRGPESPGLNGNKSPEIRALNGTGSRGCSELNGSVSIDWTERDSNTSQEDFGSVGNLSADANGLEAGWKLDFDNGPDHREDQVRDPLYPVPDSPAEPEITGYDADEDSGHQLDADADDDLDEAGVKKCLGPEDELVPVEDSLIASPLNSVTDQELEPGLILALNGANPELHEDNKLGETIFDSTSSRVYASHLLTKLQT